MIESSNPRRTTPSWLMWVAVLAFGAFSTQAGTPPAEGPYVGPGRYEIENKASGKVLEVNLRDGRTVQQWPRAHRKNQQWDIETAGNGYVYVKSAENGMVLEIEGGNARDGARVIVSPRTGVDSQLWKIEGNERLVRFTSRVGKALDLPNGSRNDGVAYQVSKPASQDNQRFRLAWISPPVPEGRNTPASDSGLTDEKSPYDLGYSLGVEDFKARLRRTYARHNGKYAQQWQEAFIEGYYDGYDSGRPDTSTMRPAEKDYYDDGFRRGKQDYQEGRRPNYMRHSSSFNPRFEPFFRRGYEDGYYSAR